jgi:sulfide:quinone oxidoreductase
MKPQSNPQILVLGGNFAGLGAARKIREHAGDGVEITVIDRKAYLDSIPNIPLEVLEGRDPAATAEQARER